MSLSGSSTIFPASCPAIFVHNVYKFSMNVFPWRLRTIGKKEAFNINNIRCINKILKI